MPEPAIADVYHNDDLDDPMDFEEESEDQGMGQLLDSMDPIKPLRRGEVVDGEVMGFLRRRRCPCQYRT